MTETKQPPSYHSAFTAYAVARVRQEEAKKILSEREAEKRKCEQVLVDAMLDAKTKTYTLENGMTVSLRKRFDANVNQENSEQVEEWLLEFIGDVAPFQKKVLYKPAVMKMLKEKFENDELDLTTVPEFLNLKTTPGVTVRGWKGEAEDE